MNETQERPIIFSGDSVRAILAGRKTQSRRVIKKWKLYGQIREMHHSAGIADFETEHLLASCPHGMPGQRLWVRETWAPHPHHPRCRVAYRADMKSYGLDGGFAVPHDDSGSLGCCNPSPVYGDAPFPDSKWKSSMFMPRWASRITLEICSVRVERLQEITHDDCMAEGMALDDAVYDFSKLWDSLNAGRGYGWESNCWVWVLGFRVLEGGGA